MVQSGRFVTFMLRPYSYFQYALAQKVGQRGFCLFVEVLPVYLIFLFGFNLNLLPVYPLWAIVSIALSFLIGLYVNFCVGIISFWTTKSDGLSRAISVLRELCAGSIIPLVFLPEPMQKLLLFLPFQFITYVPIRVFLGSYQLAGITMSIPTIVGIQALVLIAMHLIYKILWSFALKRFSGVGA
jgi:ABC-2 type transport system permease protein